MSNIIHQSSNITHRAERKKVEDEKRPDGGEQVAEPQDQSTLGEQQVAAGDDKIARQEEAPAKQEAPPAQPPAEEAPPAKKMRLVATIDVDPAQLGLGDMNDGGQRKANKTIALVPEDRLGDLASEGVYAPDIIGVLSDENMGNGGRLEVVPVRPPNQQGNQVIVRQFEVPSDMLVEDGQGHAPIHDFHVGLLPNEEHYIFYKDDVAKLQREAFEKAVPPGFKVQIADSKEGALVDKTKGLVSGLAQFGGMFTQASLLGFWSIPGAPIIATATGGFSIMSQLDNLKGLYNQRAYAERAHDKVGSDIIPWQMPDGSFTKVSYEAVSKQLKKQTLMAQAGVASSATLLGAGVSALVGATAWTPWIAGAGLALGLGTNVVDTVREMRELSAEKKELQALLDQGQTTIKKTVAVENGLVETNMPIDQRLEQIQAEQRRGTFMMTALAGGLGSAVATFGMGVGTMAALPISLVPLGGLAAFNAVRDMSKLGAEKKELEAAKEQGDTTVKRTVLAQNGQFVEIDYPIDTRLQEIDTKIKGKKVLLSGVAAGGLMLGATAGLGMSFLAAAPLALIPAATAIALFPKETKMLLKAVWQGVKNMINNVLGRNKDKKVIEGLGRPALNPTLSPAESKMVKAFEKLKAADPENAAKFNSGLARMNGMFATPPETPEDMQAQMMAGGADFKAAYAELKAKDPEALAAWEAARNEASREIAAEAVKADDAQALLARGPVQAALEETGLDKAAAENLLVTIMVAQNSGDDSELKAIDKKAGDGDVEAQKQQRLAAVLNQQMFAAAGASNAQVFENDEQKAQAVTDHVNQALADPLVQEAFGGAGFQELLERNQVDADFARQAFATFAAADIDPSGLNELAARAQSGDTEAQKTIQVGREMIGLIQMTAAQKAQAGAPQLSADQVEAQVQQAVNSDFTKAVLKAPEVAQTIEGLGADQATVNAALEKLYRADLTKDMAPILELRDQAGKGDQEALKQLQIIGTFQAVGEAVVQSMQQQPQQPAA